MYNEKQMCNDGNLHACHHLLFSSMLKDAGPDLPSYTGLVIILHVFVGICSLF